MLPFQYLRPRTSDEVVSLLAEHGREARLLAGGTDLTVGLRYGAIATRLIIDVKRVGDLQRGVWQDGQVLRIGADVVMADLVKDPVVNSRFHALGEAAIVVGSPQIRNRATLVGNICNASPAADTVPALALYGAYVTALGPRGRRDIPVANFITGNRQLDLAGDEFVICVSLPMPEAPFAAAFDRITRRRGVDLATVNLCCGIGPDRKALLAIGAASPRPLLVRDDTGIFSDRDAAPGERKAVLEALVAAATPITDVRASAEYRRAMLKVLAQRTLTRAIERLEAWGNHV